MLQSSEHALHQLKGCPEVCPLVDGKPCDPNAVYTKVPTPLRDRPEVKGHAHLCDPCLKLVQADHDREQHAKRTDRRTERETKRRLKVAARVAAREAEDQLRDAFERTRAARQSAVKAGEDYQTDLVRCQEEVDQARREVKAQEQEMLAARQRYAKARRQLDGALAQAEELPRPVAPELAEERALDVLRAALARAENAWTGTTGSARKKGLDKGLHKRANKLLRQSS